MKINIGIGLLTSGSSFLYFTPFVRSQPNQLNIKYIFKLDFLGYFPVTFTQFSKSSVSKVIHQEAVMNFRAARAQVSLPPATSRRNPFMPQQVQRKDYFQTETKKMTSSCLYVTLLEMKHYSFQGRSKWSRTFCGPGDRATTSREPRQGCRGTGEGGR